METRGRWALVTGASSGIGRDVARQLARRGASCVLVARRADRLQELADELITRWGVAAEVEAVDLLEDGAVDRLHRALRARDRRIDILVNNAGFAVHGAFLDQDLDRVQDMLRLNTQVLTALTHRFGNDMATRGTGHVLNVGSVAGLCPVPSYSAYAATKAYVVSLSEALAFELEPRGVGITVVLPSATDTEFFAVSGQRHTLYRRLTSMSSEDVARIAVDAMQRGRHSVVTGWHNVLTMAVAKLFTRRALAWLTWQLNRTDR